MFQGHIQSFQVPFPFKGINTNADNDSTSARFIQNLLIGDNQTGKLRFGTNLVSQFAFDANRRFGANISVMSFLKTDGTSEKLVYVQYLTKLLYLDIEDHVTVAPCVTNDACSTITIDISTYTADQKAYFTKVLFEGVFLYVQQTVSDGDDIENFNVIGDIITFDLPFNTDFFEQDGGENAFEFWVERGGIYRLKLDNTLELVTDELDPNIIVSSVNFQNRLLIANGVDPIKVYDGTTITDLKGSASVPAMGNIVVAGSNLQFNISQTIVPEIQGNIKINDVLTLISDAETKNVTVTNIVFAAPVGSQVQVTITVNPAPQANVRKIIYKKLVPSFSFLNVSHRRLWALAEGRPYQNKFRSSELSMKVYYAAKLESIDGWFNERTNQIDFIDMSNTSSVPDNLEVISSFEGRMLFLGRDTCQVWIGEDPTVKDDGQNVELPDFKWEMTLPVGVIQKTLYVEIPNNFVFLSKFGIVSINSLNLAQRLEVSYRFSVPIDHHLNNQLAFIETDRDYRNMRAFLYPYGRFIGFKIKYSCFIYQLSNSGGWTVFSENFAESTSFFYDATTKDLFLGLPGGQLLIYADKILTQSYAEHGKGKLSWLIAYNWIYIGDTWNNTHVYIGGQTLKPLTVNTRFFLDQDESRSIVSEIVLQQKGVLYDVAQFDEKPYSSSDSGFFHETIRFSCDSIMIEVNGLSNDLFVFDKLFLGGGSQLQPRRTIEV